jgi:hypothetical protein
MQADIVKLRKYFATLSFSQKKEFIVNLKNKLDKANSPPHRALLEECVRAYNAEVREKKNEPKLPDITPESFAKAFAAMVGGGITRGFDVKPLLIGKWQRDPEEGNQYYIFNQDGTFQTNEFEGVGEDTLNFPNAILVGDFTVSPDNIVLMEPHEKLKFNSLMFSQAGDSLIIRLKDGLTFEYKKV